MRCYAGTWEPDDLFAGGGGTTFSSRSETSIPARAKPVSARDSLRRVLAGKALQSSVRYANIMWGGSKNIPAYDSHRDRCLTGRSRKDLCVGLLGLSESVMI